MKYSKFISVVIATLLLFCSADAFAHRSRGGRASHSSRTSCLKSGTKTQYVGAPIPGDYLNTPFNSCYTHLGGRYYKPIKSIATASVSNRDNKSSSIHFSKRNVLSSPCPSFGYEVSKKTAVTGSILITHSSGDLYYREGIFFKKCPDSRKYAIHKPICGLHIPVLPKSSSMYELNGTAYYCYYATYYTYDESTQDFVVVTPPVGLVVDKVPCDAKEIMVDGDHYYIDDNVLYKEVDSKYEVAKLDKYALHLIKDFLASNK